MILEAQEEGHYRQIISNATKTINLFHEKDNLGKKPIVFWQSDTPLLSLNQFRSSQQIGNNNIQINSHQITNQTLNYNIQSTPLLTYNKWPQSCIGLILCEHLQNNQTFFVYGTGILIHNSIVLTSIQNVYSRKLHTQYNIIKFITGVIGNKCSRIYDVKRVHYLKEYASQEQNDYNFTVLQLYDDLVVNCGYIGLRTLEKIQQNKELIRFEYMKDKQGYFQLQQMNKKFEQTNPLSRGILVMKQVDQYYVVGLENRQQTKGYSVLSQKIKNIINQWTFSKTIYFNYGIHANRIKCLSLIDWTDLTKLDLYSNYIGRKGCQYLSKANLTHLSSINLDTNQIDAQGCKYLAKANWTDLTIIYLGGNNVGIQGIKYLIQVSWIHLTTFDFNCDGNGINANACKIITQANWINLVTINLGDNNIGAQGCKYLSEAKWMHLTTLYLWDNFIDDQGCKYLIRANWRYLSIINLYSNRIGAQGCKYLSQTNWRHLTELYLGDNKIENQGIKYLSETNWTNLTNIDLYMNNLDMISQFILTQCWPNVMKKSF